MVFIFIFKTAINAINKFEKLIVTKCKNDEIGIIYGHTHMPAIKKIDQKYAINTGDQCGNFTCIVETLEGKFQLIKLVDNSILEDIFL